MTRRGLLLLAFAASPRRIISTAPGITETLFALGLGDRVVGVTDYCKYPPEVTKLPKIGTWTTPNLEVILSLRPDLVIVQRTTVHSAAKYQKLGLRTLEIRLDDIETILQAMGTIGAAAGVPDQAKALQLKMRQGLQDIANRIGLRPRTSALFVVGRNNGSLDGMIAAGPHSYLDELLTAAGGRNVLADARVPYVKVLQEELLARNPQVIVDAVAPMETTAMSAAQIRSELALWDKYPTIPAVRNHRVHLLSSEVFVVPGPRLLDCARLLAGLLHPGVFPQ